MKMPNRLFYNANAFLGSLGSTPGALFEIFGNWLWETTISHGILVLVPVDDHSRFRGCIDQSLDLISHADTINYQRIRRNIRRILLMPYINCAAYTRITKSCIIDISQLLPEGQSRPDPVVLSCVLVHEATHGRMCESGIWQAAAIRLRTERACMRTMRRFAQPWFSLPPLSEIELKNMNIGDKVAKLREIINAY